MSIKDLFDDIKREMDSLKILHELSKGDPIPWLELLNYSNLTPQELNEYLMKWKKGGFISEPTEHSIQKTSTFHILHEKKLRSFRRLLWEAPEFFGLNDTKRKFLKQISEKLHSTSSNLPPDVIHKIMSKIEDILEDSFIFEKKDEPE